MPIALDCMCGPNAPWSRALEWCGWATRPRDWLIDPAHDLSSPRLQSEIRAEIASVDALLWAMDCSTLTRARDRPIPGEAHPPMRLRSSRYLTGLPVLQKPQHAALLQRVQHANSLVTFSGSTLLQAVSKNLAAIAENPRNSYYWEFPELVQFSAFEEVNDVDYMACALGGARAKKQRLRGNVSEMADLQSVCRHVHSETEWDRVREASGRYAYPTKEEAEFTADLAFAVAIRLSAWAVKRGRAKLSLPRWTIKPQETGRRDFLVSLPPELLRREAMVGIGLRLGLSPPAELACSIPARRSLAEGFAPTTFRHAVYIGAGNLPYKMVAGPLAPRFFPGPDGDAALCVVKYAQLIRSDDTIQLSIEAIADWVENLICDCPLGTPCHGEPLAVAIMQHRRSTGHATAVPASPHLPRSARAVLPSQHTRSKGGLQIVGRTARGLKRPFGLAAAAQVAQASASLEAHITLPWSQCAVDRAFRKFFPPEWLEGIAFPCLEDLINRQELCAWRDWSANNQCDDSQSYPDVYRTGWAAAAVGAQRGALHSKHQVQPLVGYGLGQEAHFHACLGVAEHRREPWSQAVTAPPDLQFAAQSLVHNRDDIRAHHERVGGALEERPPLRRSGPGPSSAAAPRYPAGSGRSLFGFHHDACHPYGLARLDDAAALHRGFPGHQSPGG